MRAALGALIGSLLLSIPSYAEHGSATAEPGTNMSCGQMMAQRAVLPSKMQEVLLGVAENLEIHAKWMGTKDKAAKAEHDALIKLAKQHREMAAQMKKTAEQMTALKDLPAAPHDMTTRPREQEQAAMTKQVKLQREMAALITRDADQAEAMLSGTKAGSGSN